MARRCLLLALLLVACNNRNYVRVIVTGLSSFSEVTALRVNVTHNTQTGTVSVPVPSSPRPDPFDFSLEFDADRTGQVNLNIEGRNSDDALLARGSTVADLAKGVVDASLTLQQLPAPFVTNLTPLNCHRPSGGAQIFVNGGNFTSGSVVLWGSTLNPLNTTFRSASQVEIVTPRGFEGQDVNVFVRNPDGQTSNSVPFYYRTDALTCPFP